MAVHQPSLRDGREIFGLDDAYLPESVAKKQLWSISEMYQTLATLHRSFSAALARGCAEEAAALRQRLLQSLHRLREVQLEELRGLHAIRKAPCQASAQIAELRAREAALEAELATHAEAKPSPQELDLQQRLISCDQALSERMRQTERARRLAERLSAPPAEKRAAQVDTPAVPATADKKGSHSVSELLLAAEEASTVLPDAEPVTPIQDRSFQTLDVAGFGSALADLPETGPGAGFTAHSVNVVSAPSPHTELLSLVLEEVGVASEQLAESFSPWRSASSRRVSTPSTPDPSERSDARAPVSPHIALKAHPPEDARREESSTSVSSSQSPLYRQDRIDSAMAAFLRQRRNRLRRSLFSRVGQGLYRYGTCRMRLRLASAQGDELEAADSDTEIWEPLEDFARRVEQEQSQLLRRARERAKVLRKL
ncbi:unnamed protein product [Effrenium voratum]|nr:unnamed protein product [Effrenium voratum]